jgi:hypothetical protein
MRAAVSKRARTLLERGAVLTLRFSNYIGLPLRAQVGSNAITLSVQPIGTPLPDQQ